MGNSCRTVPPPPKEPTTKPLPSSSSAPLGEAAKRTHSPDDSHHSKNSNQTQETHGTLIRRGKSWVNPDLGFKENLAKNNDISELEKKFIMGPILGEGITGLVRLCTSVEDGTIWAMKSLNVSKMDAAQIDELRAEIETLRKLDHPNIISVMEVFESDNNICIILEHCSGGDLSQRRFATENDVCSIVFQLCEAVAHCHHMNIVHRDLKMENIMFASKDSDSLRLIDFGLSKRFLTKEEIFKQDKINQAQCELNNNRVMKTACGTAFYMAPEMLNMSYSEKADVWALGVITYMLVTGRPPFEGRDEPTVFEKVRRGRVHYQEAIWKRLSPEALQFTQALLTYDPAKRPSAHDVLDLPWLRNFQQRRISLMQENGGSTLAKQVCESLIRFGSYPPLKRAALMIISHHIREQDTRQLRDLFLTLDEDHSGELTFDEIKNMIRKFGAVDLSDERLHEIFDSIDYDKTGGIHHTEFLAATLETRVKINGALLNQAFNHLDIDSTGFISCDNLQAVLGKHKTRVDIEKMVTNGKNAEEHPKGISRSEFLQMMGETVLPTPSPTPTPSDVGEVSRPETPVTSDTTISPPSSPSPSEPNSKGPEMIQPTKPSIEIPIIKPAPKLILNALPSVKEEVDQKSDSEEVHSD